MRKKLREIELKVTKFADELENLHSKKDLGKEANRGFIEQKVEGYKKVLLDDFYQTYGLDTATEPVSMDISKPASTIATHTSKSSKFFSQYTDSETQSSQESLPKRKRNKNKSKSHKPKEVRSRSRSRSRSFSSDSPSSDVGSPARELKTTHHSKKSKRRHLSSPSESRTGRRDRNYSSKKEKSLKKRRSSSNSPSHHSRAKSSRKSRRHSSDSHSPSPQKRSKKSKHI